MDPCLLNTYLDSSESHKETEDVIGSLEDSEDTEVAHDSF